MNGHTITKVAVGYIVTRAHYNYSYNDGDKNIWAFNTLKEALAFMPTLIEPKETLKRRSSDK
jgi:hypothetical protein